MHLTLIKGHHVNDWQNVSIRRSEDSGSVALKRIRLELARDHDFPEGSRHHGYEFIAPIDESDNLAPDEWHRERKRWRVRRFWAGAEEHGRLVRKPGGSWAIDYDPKDTADDEPGFRFDKHKFTPASMCRSSTTASCARSGSVRFWIRINLSRDSREIATRNDARRLSSAGQSPASRTLRGDHCRYTHRPDLRSRRYLIKFAQQLQRGAWATCDRNSGE